MSLEKDLKVNIHDVAPLSGFRQVDPYSFVQYMERTFKGQKIKTLGYGGDEDLREENCTVKIGRHEIEYQVCGLSGLDEYLLFESGTPKNIVDKTIASLVMVACGDTVAKPASSSRAGNMIIGTPDEIVEREKGAESLDRYHKRKMRKAISAMNFAKKVLNSEKSYLDTVLKDYKKPPSMGEAFVMMFEAHDEIRNFIKEKFGDRSELEQYLFESFYNFNLKVSGFEDFHKSFTDKLRSNYEGKRTADERGCGPIIDSEEGGREKHNKELKFLEETVKNYGLVRRIIKDGKVYIPELKSRIEKKEDEVMKWDE